jgi:hypothetical protein
MSGPERPDALTLIDVFGGEWSLEARFPGAAEGTGPQARATFVWILDGRFLVQRTHVPVPEAPDSPEHRLRRPGGGRLHAARLRPHLPQKRLT